ncbi:MAG: Mrp family chromosome partitioning ATPase [Planctomycetota bacterium]|jgi:Mrp family chromosome partitioning ATPase
MRNLIKKAETKSRRAEVIATELGYLWTGLLQRGVGDTHRSIGFCAIDDDEGSNTLAANLALFLGSKGMRIALVEATLRTRALAGVFQATPMPGLAEILTGQAVLWDALRQEVAAGVDLQPAGETPDPFWALGTPVLGSVLNELIHEVPTLVGKMV